MSSQVDLYDLNFPLLFFGEKNTDPWTLEDAVRGVAILGGIGSGKTSGSGRTLAKAFLKAGYGGLVLCGKVDERENWINYIKEAGRIDDVIVFSPQNPFRFNFMDYEMNRLGRGGGETRNIVNLYMTIHEMARKDAGGSQRGEDQFWQGALKRLLMRLVELIKLAGEPLTVYNMYQVVSTSLQHVDQWNDDAFITSSYCVQCLEQAHENDGESPEFGLVDHFWSREYPSLDEKTRSIVAESFYGLAEPFLSGQLRELFATTTNITPDVTHDGKILIMDLPIPHFLELGIYAQSIMKYLWQQAIERRNLHEKPCPNFLWVDEAQLFINEYDMMFQTTARSSRTCTVLLSQNISNYYAAIGGTHPKEQTDSLLGNLSTKIFHANNDAVTNEWAANTIGKRFQMISSYNTKLSEEGTSAGANHQLHHQILPTEFTTLRNGGQSNGYQVDAIVSVAGRTWQTGKNHLTLTFDQRV